MPTTHLLLIDPQNDFCDLPASHCPRDAVSGQPQAPALPVPGAHADMQRIAALVRSQGHRLDGLTVTLDTHHHIDIAHPGFWQTANAGSVAPFTPITAAQVRAGTYRSRQTASLPRALAYLDALEAHGRYTLMVWPVHCEVGTWGHNIHADVQAACRAWEEARCDQVEVVIKGLNPWTEHYSAIQAEVPDPEDPGTDVHRALIRRLDQADVVLIAGEAGSHCVRATTEHLATWLPSKRLDKLVLLSDGMSPVSGFEAQQQAFWDAMQAKGLRRMSCAEWAATSGAAAA